MAIGSGVVLPRVAENPTFPILSALAYTTGLGYRPTCEKWHFILKQFSKKTSKIAKNGNFFLCALRDVVRETEMIRNTKNVFLLVRTNNMWLLLLKEQYISVEQCGWTEDASAVTWYSHISSSRYVCSWRAVSLR